jgi:hypothetical protein
MCIFDIFDIIQLTTLLYDIGKIGTISIHKIISLPTNTIEFLNHIYLSVSMYEYRLIIIMLYCVFSFVILKKVNFAAVYHPLFGHC